MRNQSLWNKLICTRVRKTGCRESGFCDISKVEEQRCAGRAQQQILSSFRSEDLDSRILNKLVKKLISQWLNVQCIQFFFLESLSCKIFYEVGKKTFFLFCVEPNIPDNVRGVNCLYGLLRATAEEDRNTRKGGKCLTRKHYS
jgi:hypothetical protein